jgi:hypothetical protein
MRLVFKVPYENSVRRYAKFGREDILTSINGNDSLYENT